VKKKCPCGYAAQARKREKEEKEESRERGSVVLGRTGGKEGNQVGVGLARSVRSSPGMVEWAGIFRGSTVG
jgi:uncharacterized protein YcfJ